MSGSIDCESPAPSRVPDPLDRGELGAVGRHEQQSQVLGMPAQEGSQQHRLMVSGIAEHHDDATPALPVAQQAFEEAPERLGVEHRSTVAIQPPAKQIDRAEAGNEFALRLMQQDGVFVFRRHLHAVTRPLLLEMTFVQAPSLQVNPLSRAAKFFVPLRRSTDRPVRCWVGACVAGRPSAEIIFGIAAPPGPRHNGVSDARNALARPKAWQPGQSPAASCADRLVDFALLCRIESAGPTGLLPHAQSFHSALLKAVDPALYRGGVFAEQPRHLSTGLTEGL